MRHLPFFLCCLCLTGCIGSHYGSPGSGRPFAPELIGQSHDDIILKYGPPDRKAALDGGGKLWYYKVTSRGTGPTGRRIHDDCTLRVELREKRAVAASYNGDRAECERYLEFGARKNAWYDFR